MTNSSVEWLPRMGRRPVLESVAHPVDSRLWRDAGERRKIVQWTLCNCAPFLALVAAEITLYWQPISPFLTASLDCWKLGCMFRWWIPAMISKLTVHTQATKNTPAGGKNNVKSSFLPNQSISEWASRGNNQYGYSEFLLASRHSHLRIC